MSDEPAPAPVRRRLTAILAADAVGYSAHMADNEERTLRTLSGHRSVMSGLIAAHDGRIVGTAGDSVLAEFGSSVAAVRCAVEIQEALATRNNNLPEVERLEFRIGVNLGDVIVEGEDILGDGVNVAARLESIADPGGVCISSSVFDQISGKLNLGFDDMGDQSLKNIARPVRAYRVAGTTGTPRPVAKPAAARPNRMPMVAGIAAVLVIGAAAAAWLVLRPAPTAPAQSSAPVSAGSSAADPNEEAKLKLQLAEAERAKAEADLERARVERTQRTPAGAPATSPGTAANAAADAAASDAASRGQTGAARGGERRGAGRARFVRGVADIHCAALGDEPDASMRVPVTIDAADITVTMGTPGRPGFTTLKGTPQGDGTIVLDGTFIGMGRAGRTGRGQAHYEGKLLNGRGTLAGHQGARQCTIALALN